MTTGLSLRATLSHGGRATDHTQRPEPRGDGRPFTHQPLLTCQAAYAVVHSTVSCCLYTCLQQARRMSRSAWRERPSLEGHPITMLPLPPCTGSIGAKNRSFVRQTGGGASLSSELSLIPYHNLCRVNLHTFLTMIRRAYHGCAQDTGALLVQEMGTFWGTVQAMGWPRFCPSAS